LVNSIEEAESFKYDTPEVRAVRQLRDTALSIVKDGEVAMEIMEEKHLRDVLQRADEIKLITPTIKRIRECVALLDNGEEQKFLEMQLAVTSKRNDTARIGHVKSSMRALLVKTAGAKFDLQFAPGLRRPDEWAKLKVLTVSRADLAKSMLVHTDEAIHAPLTSLHMEVEALTQEKKDSAALRFFNSMLLYLKGQDVQLELLTTALDCPYLRNEIYCQVLKQLTDIPAGWPRERGWKLLGMLCKFIPPQGPEMECVVESFLAKHEAQLYIDDLHKQLFSVDKPVFQEDDLHLMRLIKEPDVFAWEKSSLRNLSIDRLRCL